MALKRKLKNLGHHSDSDSNQEDDSLPGGLFAGVPDSDDEDGPTYGVKHAKLDDVDVILDKPVAPLPKRWVSSEVSIDKGENAGKREVPGKGVSRKGKRYASDSNDNISNPAGINPDEPMKIETLVQAFLDWAD